MYIYIYTQCMCLEIDTYYCILLLFYFHYKYNVRVCFSLYIFVTIKYHILPLESQHVVSNIYDILGHMVIIQMKVCCNMIVNMFYPFQLSTFIFVHDHQSITINIFVISYLDTSYISAYTELLG